MNERMTRREADGQAVMDCQKCEVDWTGKHGKPMADCTALYCRNRLKDRLAEYEDTGLTPELVREVAEFAVWVHENGMDKIREWVKAEEEKRLVVLQCKVGDTVWMWNVDFGTALPYVVDLISVINEECGYSANCNHNGELLDSIDFEDGDVGKTIFLTRDEAEKALKEVEQK